MNANTLHSPHAQATESANFAKVPEHFEPTHTVNIKEFGRVKLRPISVQDEKAMITFHETLSEESVYLRYFEHISLDTRTLHERLARVCANTPDSYAIVAETFPLGAQPAQIIAVGRLTTTTTPDKASFALLITDNANETGLPNELMRHLLAAARVYRFHAVGGELLVADHDSLNLCRSFGFKLHTVPEDGIVRVQCSL
jgi:acetyltransferase